MDERSRQPGWPSSDTTGEPAPREGWNEARPGAVRRPARPPEQRATMAPAEAGAPVESDAGGPTVELIEERLVPHKQLRQVGEAVVRKQVEEVPGRVEVRAYRDEVEVEHVPIGQVVAERLPPWEENGVMVVPVYEEQLIAVKRLVLREYLRIRRLPTTTTQVFEDRLRRDRLVIEDPTGGELVHERFATTPGESEAPARSAKSGDQPERSPAGLIERLVRRLLF